MSGLTVGDLRCEYLVDPVGIDETAPRLSWVVDSPRRGARQAAWRVRVASSAERLAAGEADAWDSGRVEDGRTAHIVYAGGPLRSREERHWDVEVWDETGAASRSAPARWTMGLLEPADWSAQWIAVDPAAIAAEPWAVAPTLTEPGTPAWFRREFIVPGPVRRAVVHASARGLFELHLGGRRVGEDLFAPEWTDYRTRLHYRTYDVTALLAPGPQVLGAVLGDGWWSGYVGWQETRCRYGSLENSLLVQLEIDLADGRRLVVGSDAAWTAGPGPIRSSDFMMGEHYDARRELTGWDQPGAAPAGWLPAREVAAPAARLVAQRSEPVRCTEELRPVAVRAAGSGTWIADFGQNFAGWVRLRTRGPAGTAVTLRHAERLNPDGSLYTANLRRAKATDVYVLRGDPAGETWEPRFTFHGFQYVEVAGLAEPPEPGTLTGCVIQSATPPAGEFTCSHAGVNRLWQNIRWSQRGNFLSVPTDCPQRDERLGWMGDAQVFARTAAGLADVAAFFTKWLVDIEDAQTPEGIFPDVAPRPPEGENHWGLDDLCGAAGWADAGVILPWTLWQVYGDTRVIERHWRAMTAWMDYLARTNPDGLRVNDLHNNYGDWLCLPSDREFRTHSPMKNLLATALWADDASKMAAMARALSRAEEAARFSAEFERVRAAFQREFVRDDGRLTVETQTAYLLALEIGLLPEALRTRAVEHLVADIAARDWHLSTGFIGIRLLNPVLTRHGRADVAYRLLLQDTYPSWLYPVRHGATTIWERWNGWTEEGGFFDPLMNSFNHYSLGSVGEWLLRHVAGIDSDPACPGYARFVLRPHVGAGLDRAAASYRSIRGRIESAWRREGDRFEWTIRVPANTCARVWLPAAPGAALEADGLVVDARDDRWACAWAPAGHYRLTSRLPG